jgi:diguanylate cyclase (GGDEF)-like protein
VDPQSSIDLSQFPDSPYADELRAGPRLGFAPALEAAYRQLHLRRVRTRARAWSVLSAVLAVLFTVQQVQAHGALHPISLLHYFFVPVALLLGWLPWSRFYESHYLQVAPYALPLIAGLTAPLSAQAASEGRYEVLIQLALQIVGIFEFTGLLYRMALVTCIALVIGFATGTVIWALPADAAVKYVATMGLATALGAVAFRGAEIMARRQFLEGQLLGELLERDPLTGLKNRRSFDDHLQRTWMQAQRDERTLAVLMIDVDDFKKYNDLYGHQAGDEALRSVARVLRDCGHRPLDLSARYGGEEFALILHDVTLDHARSVAEHIRTQVAALGILHGAASAAETVTLSIGAAVALPALGRTASGLVQLADEALYAAKAAGRNCTVVSGPEAHRALDTGIFTLRGDKLHGSAARA